MSTFDISKVDKNFAAEDIQYEGIKFYSPKEKPFKIYGLYKPEENEPFKRMPHEVAQSLNKNVEILYTNTSGGRIRFRTNSTKILVRSILPNLAIAGHMPATGSSCFDLYVNGEYISVFRHINKPDLKAISGANSENTYDSIRTLGKSEMRDILLFFPLYNDVTDVFIGLDEDAVVEEAPEYTRTKPVVFYGSSITQGGCASHPGNAYPNILSRRFDTDIINLGFSSGAKGEDLMGEYLSNLDMSVLVYDYDHNASNVEHLEKTHERMFKIIREKQPDLPVIMPTCADRCFKDTIPARREVIRRTYQNAVDKGDKNVYFIDGRTIYAPLGQGNCTVDDTHPNDLGFLMMANSIGAVLEEIFRKER